MAPKFPQQRDHLRMLKIEKFGLICQLCGCELREHSTKSDKPHVVGHHMDGNINNNAEDNMILLCPKCHSRLHRRIERRIKEGCCGNTRICPQ